MRETRMAMPKVAMIALTRGMLGMGLGMLLSDKFGRDRRKAIGWTLVAVGVATTIPLAIGVFRNRGEAKRPEAKNGRNMSMAGPMGGTEGVLAD